MTFSDNNDNLQYRMWEENIVQELQLIQNQRDQDEDQDQDPQERRYPVRRRVATAKAAACTV
jgi:hypothetical protein